MPRRWSRRQRGRVNEHVSGTSGRRSPANPGSRPHVAGAAGSSLELEDLPGQSENPAVRNPSFAGAGRRAGLTCREPPAAEQPALGSGAAWLRDAAPGSVRARASEQRIPVAAHHSATKRAAARPSGREANKRMELSTANRDLAVAIDRGRSSSVERCAATPGSMRAGPTHASALPSCSCSQALCSHLAGRCALALLAPIDPEVSEGRPVHASFGRASSLRQKDGRM